MLVDKSAAQGTVGDGAGSLNQNQNSFSGALLDAKRPTPSDIVGPTPEKKAVKRFNVYRNNVMASLTEAMMDSYPTVKELVGEEFFRAMAGVYIPNHPPTSAALISFGLDFPQFLENFEPAQSIPYLADIARLEAAWLQAYHARDHAPMAAEALQAVEEDLLAHLTFEFHPATNLIRSPYPIFSIWAAHKQEDPASAMERLEPVAQDCLVTRPQWDVNVIALPAGGGAFISALMSGQSLADAAEAATKEDAGFDLAINIGGLLEVGACTNCFIPDEQH